jgi:hypothetical protein
VLGRVDMKEMNSWVEVDKGSAAKMISALDGKKHSGRAIRMNEADGGFKPGAGDSRGGGENRGGGDRGGSGEGRKRTYSRDRN